MDYSKKAESAAENLAQKSEDLVTKAGAKARTTAEGVREQLSEAGTATKGILRKTSKEGADAVSRVTDHVRSSVDVLQEDGFTGIMNDVETLIKRYPIHAVLIGAGIGFIVARTRMR